MREIVAYNPEKKELNLRQTLLAGKRIDDLLTFFKYSYFGHASDLMEEGRSLGTVIYLPDISAQELFEENPDIKLKAPRKVKA